MYVGPERGGDGAGETPKEWPFSLAEFGSFPESQKPSELQQIQGLEPTQASGCLLSPVLTHDCVHVLVPWLVTPDPCKTSLAPLIQGSRVAYAGT